MSVITKCGLGRGARTLNLVSTHVELDGRRDDVRLEEEDHAGRQRSITGRNRRRLSQGL